MSGMSNHAKTLIITPERTPFPRRGWRGLPVRSTIMSSRARKGNIARPLRRSAAAKTLPASRLFGTTTRIRAERAQKKDRLPPTEEPAGYGRPEAGRPFFFKFRQAAECRRASSCRPRRGSTRSATLPAPVRDGRRADLHA